MRTTNLHHSTSWESAYQGKLVTFRSRRTSRRIKGDARTDLSESMLFFFYAATFISILGYFYYLNQESIRDFVTRQIAPVTSTSRTVQR